MRYQTTNLPQHRIAHQGWAAWYNCRCTFPCHSYIISVVLYGFCPCSLNERSKLVVPLLNLTCRHVFFDTPSVLLKLNMPVQWAILHKSPDFWLLLSTWEDVITLVWILAWEKQTLLVWSHSGPSSVNGFPRVRSHVLIGVSSFSGEDNRNSNFIKAEIDLSWCTSLVGPGE